MWFLNKKKEDPRLGIIFHIPEDIKHLAPTRAHDDDLGIDFKSPTDGLIPPRGFLIINTLVAASMPKDYGLLLKTRSSMAAKGITVLGGVIDPSYTGLIKVVLANLSDTGYTINRGDKIAQGILQKNELVTITIVNNYPEEKGRGAKGFGSSGK